MSQETRDISLDGEVHVSEDPDVMDTDECPEEGDEALQVEEEPCEPTVSPPWNCLLALSCARLWRWTLTSHRVSARRRRRGGLRNTWVDVTPGMSWHERESAGERLTGKFGRWTPP